MGQWCQHSRSNSPFTDLQVPTIHCLVTVVEDALKVPNGIAFSPDGRICYISDTGSVSSNLLQQYPGYQNFNVTNHHAVYAFDVVGKVAGRPYLTNKRPIFQSADWILDGPKVSRERICSGRHW